jgi:hypothetical protein
MIFPFGRVFLYPTIFPSGDFLNRIFFFYSNDRTALEDVNIYYTISYNYYSSISISSEFSSITTGISSGFSGMDVKTILPLGKTFL